MELSQKKSDRSMHRGPLESLDEYQSEHVQSKTPQRQSRKTSRETITEKL